MPADIYTSHSHVDHRPGIIRPSEMYTMIFHCFLVIESHPDNALEDLRLDQPFAELKDHFKSYDLDSMNKKVCMWIVAYLTINVYQLCSFFHTWFFYILFFICRNTVTHHGLLLLLHTWRNGSVRYGTFSVPTL